MGSATISCSGNITALSHGTYDVGTSVTTITGASTLTSNGKTWTNDLTIDASGKTVSTADDLTIAGDLAVTAGTFNISGDDIAIGGDLTIDAGATFTIDASSTITLSGNSTVTTGGKTLPQLTVNGNTAINTGCTIDRLIYGTDGKTVTWQQGQTFTISNLTAANWNGAAAALNSMVSSNAGTRATVDIPGATSCEYMSLKDINVTGATLTVNDGTSQTQGNNRGCVFSGTISLDVSTGPVTGGTTVTLTDTGNCFGGSFDVTVGGDNATDEIVVDSQHGAFKTPAHAAGTVDVVLTTSDNEVITKSGAFTYESAGALIAPKMYYYRQMKNRSIL